MQSDQLAPRPVAWRAQVCYHNARSVSDYGDLGHGEVVGMRIPPSKFGAMADEYFKLFDEKGRRPDQSGDRGTEYRNLVGLPGGKASPLAKELVAASQRQGDKLDFAVGKGDDADTVALAWIYDTNEYPFYIAEVRPRGRGHGIHASHRSQLPLQLPRPPPLKPAPSELPLHHHRCLTEPATAPRNRRPTTSSTMASVSTRCTRSRTTTSRPARPRPSSSRALSAPTVCSASGLLASERRARRRCAIVYRRT